jgi:amino-acid N-acetyltransferase
MARATRLQPAAPAWHHAGMEIAIVPAADEDLPQVRVRLTDAGLTRAGIMEVPTALFVARRAGEVVGTAALERHGRYGLVRSVVVADEHRGGGLGSRLLDAVEEEAGRLGLAGLYLLTETAAPFFARRGYEVIDRDAGPNAVMASIEWSVVCSDTAVAMARRTGTAENPGSVDDGGP